MKEDQKEENNNPSNLQNDNLTKDSFLFVFSVEKIDISFLCGCTLFAGIRLISICMVINGLSNVFFSYKNENYLDFILSFIYLNLLFLWIFMMQILDIKFMHHFFFLNYFYLSQIVS